MKIIQITPGTEEFRIFSEALKKEVNKEPEDFGITSEDKSTLILCGFSEKGLESFAIFRSFLDLSLHIGTMVEPSYLKSLKEIENAEIFEISIVRTTGSNDKLAEATTEFIGEAERILLDRAEACCLMISLLEKGNAKSFPLWKKLGFKRKGGKAYLMELSLIDVVKRYGKVSKREGEILLKTFDELNDDNLKTLASCYSKIFAPSLEGEVYHYLQKMISKKSFLKNLSTVVCNLSNGEEVIGFCFIERENDSRIYISAAGLNENMRGKGVSMRSFSWIMENCINCGYKKASLVTASRKLKSFFSRSICAHHVDNVVRYIKCSARDE